MGAHLRDGQLSDLELQKIIRRSRPRLISGHQERIDLNRDVKYLKDRKPCSICGAGYDDEGRFEYCVGPVPEGVAVLVAEIRRLRPAPVPEPNPVYEPTVAGCWYGILNVEGDGTPYILLPSRGDAERELERRRALPEDDDERLTEYHQVFPAHLAGAVWNSYEGDPRSRRPLDAEEILAVHRR